MLEQYKESHCAISTTNATSTTSAITTTGATSTGYCN